jgi:hypothetical protein
LRGWMMILIYILEKNCVVMDWLHLAEDRVQWQGFAGL